ncbi:TetR/AcrR family transcriptional regulator [Tunturibacter empetritectus]|uniref:AcrR family transcriptional regulator n=1 Tax=Tunturiibacter empetritectus TaxID=3069691 RepID=A0A7W8MPV9_9BACT|nr:TetR/AcrR family transcriptional regulator [Edaphobacter lichenicola]MBB5316106.1 AcrR family transcriptional regulator [Edaphobacter lichenicola]
MYHNLHQRGTVDEGSSLPGLSGRAEASYSNQIMMRNSLRHCTERVSTAKERLYFTKMRPEMTVKTANKHELRTRETRSLLLQAAETIFVRDGYEGAELGEIAALAGRTKGAIYAQFKSKEDIFLALIEERTNYYRARMEKILAASMTVDGNMDALRNFFLERTEDQAWSLLLLEFKLFAMRHPESRKRLQTLYAEIFYRTDEKKLADILGAAAKGKDAISRVIAVQTLGPVISALVLELQLDNHLLNKNVIKKVANRIFDALLEVPAQ